MNSVTPQDTVRPTLLWEIFSLISQFSWRIWASINTAESILWILRAKQRSILTLSTRNTLITQKLWRQLPKLRPLSIPSSKTTLRTLLQLMLESWPFSKPEESTPIFPSKKRLLNISLPSSPKSLLLLPILQSIHYLFISF